MVVLRILLRPRHITIIRPLLYYLFLIRILIPIPIVNTVMEMEFLKLHIKEGFVAPAVSRFQLLIVLGSNSVPENLSSNLHIE